MALKNPDNNIKYLRLRDGAFYVGKDKENPSKELEGRITGMFFKDEEYEGAPVRKLIVRLVDEAVDETYQVGLNTDSQNYSTFVSFLKGADLSQPLTLHPKVESGEKDGKPFKKNGILISQNGTYTKGYFTKATPNGAPEWKAVKVGKKTVIDKSEYLNFLEEFVTENYINKLPKVAAPAAKKAVAAAEAEPETEATEKLPWDND